MKVDAFGGTVAVAWDSDAAATPLVHLAFFAECLKVSGRFDALAADRPLHYANPNAPSKRDAPGTVMLSILAGQWRYAHITALRGDGVNHAPCAGRRRSAGQPPSLEERGALAVGLA